MTPVGSKLLLISGPFGIACSNILISNIWWLWNIRKNISTKKKSSIDRNALKHQQLKNILIISIFIGLLHASSEFLYCRLFFLLDCRQNICIFLFLDCWNFLSLLQKPTVWVDWIYFICDQYFKQIPVYFSDHLSSSSLIIWVTVKILNKSKQ